MNIIKRLFSRKSSGSLYEHNLKFYVLNGIMLNIVTNLYKPLSSKFLFRMGGTEFHISLINALPGLFAFLILIPGIKFVSNSSNKKKMILLFNLASRVFVLSFAFIPYIPQSLRPMTFVLLLSLMNFPEAVFSTSVQSLSGDVFSKDLRATAITARNKYSTVSGFIVLMAIGQIMARLGSSDEIILRLYQVFFVLAFLLGLVEIFYLKQIDVDYEKTDKLPKITSIFKEILANKRFTRFLIASIIFHFGWQMGWPLYSIYQIKYLGADEGWLTIMMITMNVSMFFSFSQWRRIINKFGNQFSVIFATLGLAFSPLMFALSPNLYVLTIAGIVIGFFTAGTTTVILNYMLESTPVKNRIMYVAIHGTFTNLSLFIAPIVGGAVLSATTIYGALYFTGVLRLVGSASFYFLGKRRKGEIKI